jgi:Tfp pilus assembly protein PilE
VKPSCPEHIRLDAAGYLLLDLLVFMALLVVILGLACQAYWRCSDNSRRLQQNAADILAAVQAGERWREDIRLGRDIAGGAESVKIVQSGDVIEYRFSEQAVWRRSTQTGRTIRLLSGVKASEMQRDTRRQVSAWRWEVELRSGKNPPYLRPLFTFEAVPAK